MKNIFTILSGIGIEIPEEKKTEFETAFNENYKTVSEMEKVRTARDNYKTQLETAQNALKEFEGVDVKDLQDRIKTLNADLEKKDTEYQNKIADMEFNSILDSAITKSGARNAKAVRGLLDLDSLKSSKNKTEDITRANIPNGFIKTIFVIFNAINTRNSVKKEPKKSSQPQIHSAFLCTRHIRERGKYPQRSRYKLRHYRLNCQRWSLHNRRRKDRTGC